ncbi:shikimate O-hydroxycinnamoyltransferase-like [Carica papaya]|uniref:shikimate O-hydroxycinnamoyltransferase-like n=1 Tax=Carica papaya TaxID=3649 RepID=UPI000B8CAC52|nr:shikimate O-hydroxycinnamoyltransferase-like [Carica papaya]
MSATGDFTVRVRKKEVVRALLPLQEHWLPLSNLDLLLPPVDVSVFFCYSNSDAMSFAAMVAVLKKSLAETIVSYYAFAGELLLNSAGEPELLCNNRGVDFIEAYADVELRNLDLYNPDASIQGKLVPEKKRGVLSVQTTELKCGGVVIGCTFDHRIADAYSTNMFFVSWAEMARSTPMSVIPCFRRSLLNPRHPSHLDPFIDQLFQTISLSKISHQHTENLLSRIYYIKAEHLYNFQSLASSNGIPRSKLESFSAFLWKLMAQFAEQNNKMISKMGIIVDGRTRFSNERNETAKIMASYFGNVLSIPYGEHKVNELVERPLFWVANEVHRFIENALNRDHFLGLIDWVEAHRPQPTVAKIYKEGSNDGPAFVVSSGQRFPVCEIDFGWGRPIFGSYHFPWGGQTGYVMPMPSATINGDWVVYMHLLKEQLEFIENVASHIFRPLTADYLCFN